MKINGLFFTFFFCSQIFGHLHGKQYDQRDLLRISFDDGMKPVGRFLKHNVESDPFWKMVKVLYTTQIEKKIDYRVEPTIPKIIHHIWLGSSLPEQYIIWRNTWIKKHPDWQCILWTDKDVEALGLINKKMYDATSNYGEKSDIARVEILYRFGGLYVDTDFECLKSFDTLHHCLDFYAGLNEGPSAVFNGLMASAPGHPILKAYIENMKRGEHEVDSTDAIVHRSGPHYFTKILKKYLRFHKNRVVLFPTTFFYPWPWWHRFDNKREQILKWVRPETFAIHHWEVSWNGGVF